MVDHNGRGGNSVFFGDENTCGIHASDRLPSTDAEINPDQEYRSALLSLVATEEASPPHGR